ncbi:protoporphyrinogen ix oxidase, putative form, hemj [hydrocarbon metagenome]|uniref:Protoporphyrinogen ix oxidase, putative form, hemj n=1 Tax=hydrocarbon metagenome TaxID=938273 RepID=A0A0W8E5U8_9ZZZZ
MLSFALKAAVMYFMALIMIRFLGKRALGELGPFDFVVMTGVGHTVVSVALDKSIPFWEGMVILATLAALEYLMGYLALKNQNLANIITGKPVILINEGRIIKENLKKEKFNVDDLMQELRKQGIRDLDEVDKGILESCGGFSVLLREEDEPVSRRDLGLKPLKRSEVLTTQPVTRGDFFQNEQRERWSESAPLSITESLLRIEERLKLIGSKVERIEEQLKSSEPSL